MKKIFFLLGPIFFTTILFAQEPTDALRFSWTIPGGTARQQAIGGAMGSLGGDITAAFSNPAGLAFYKTGDLVFSPIYQIGKSKATYLNRTETNENNKMLWGTTGFIVGSGGQQDKKVKNSSFGIAFNRSADFNNHILYRGANNQSSYSQKFLDEIGSSTDANNVAGNYPFGTSLALNTYWIDTIRGTSGQVAGFKTIAPITTGLLQQQDIKSRGGINEFAIAGAVNVNNKVMIGGSLGVPILNYERDATYLEADATSDKTNNFDFASFSENLTTKGVGFNLRAGVIFKLQDYWRLGLAFHTPSVYNLTDNYETSITTNTENYQGVQTQSSTLFNNGATSSFKYMFFTPYRLIGSASYVLREVEDVTRQKGFITADVEFINYKAASFKEDNENGSDASTVDYLKSLNKAIDNAYKGTLNFRLGGEVKFTTLMVRAGVAYYGNPYQNIHGEKGSKLNVSGGLGYRNKGFFMDLTYVHSIQKDVHFPYRLENAPYFGANIKSNVGNVLATVGFKL
jgi:hypothetical protein